MTVNTIPLGSLQANCYYLCDGTTSVLIDVGEYGEDLKAFLATKQVKPSAVLLTHGHFDHICGAVPYQNENGIPIYIGKEDRECLSSNTKSLSCIAPGYTLVKPSDSGKTVSLDRNESFSVGSLEFKTIYTPGHTKGGVTYLTDNFAFCGDTVFKGSAGRTDFPGGDDGELFESIGKIKLLRGSTLLYTGHGEPTTVENEISTNPYFIRG